jgi:hypothetical protein
MTLLMAGIRGIDNEGPFTRPPESTDGSIVHCLFSVRNMFFSKGPVLACFDP